MDGSSKNLTNSPNPALQRTFCHNQRRELASFSFGQEPLRSSAPEIVIPTDRHLARLNVGMNRPYWFKLSFHYTFDDADGPTGWWITTLASASARSH